MGAPKDPSVLRYLPLASIHPHPANVREVLAEIEDLAQSIREVGLIQPLSVAPDGDGYVLIAGHRRHAAASLANLSEVPAVVRTDLHGERLVQAMLIEKATDPSLYKRAQDHLAPFGGGRG